MDSLNVLDAGFVRLVEHMGSDDSIVRAARVSYGEGTTTRSNDRGLIRYLVRHQHTTPLEMVEFTFHVKAPLFVARQWMRHRMASINEESARYSIMSDEFYIPDTDTILPQSADNRQGRAETNDLLDANAIGNQIRSHSAHSLSVYKELIDSGLTRELARLVMPVNVYTQFYWKVDLHNALRFLKLRMDSHAQYEMQCYARQIAELIRPRVPLTWEAWEDYVYNSYTVSNAESALLKGMLSNQEAPSITSLVESGLSRREATQFVKQFFKP